MYILLCIYIRFAVIFERVKYRISLITMRFCDEHSREPNFAFLLKSDLFLTHLEFTFHSYNYKRLHGIIDWQLEYIN